MPDYIQLLETKLSPIQKQALNAMTDVARTRSTTIFLTGGAVRDIVSGASVRDLDITVQANPLKFRKDLEKAGFTVTGQHEPSQTVYLRFGTQARVEISAARSEEFPKPGRPEYRSASILDDLRRRDFTANAMALSLNEGSWGLLLDPLNGTADIYARQLRLVGNYGFLEDPIRMVRAIRLLTRTGWEMEERTRARYDNAKDEGVANAISAAQRGYELEEIAYEEEPLPVMKALESEGWMGHLSPNWSSRSVDVAGLGRLHERLVQLLMAGLHPDPSASQFRLLTAKLSPAHLTSLKRLFVRTDLIEEADALDREAKKVLQKMTGKDAAKPSQLWKLLHSVNQEAVLWLFFTGKGSAIQNRFENFFTKWPEARQKIPNAILQDMRILPDVSGYEELLDKLTFAFMDAELPNEESIRKFAEPYSPPAPPPPVIVRRSRTAKKVVEPKGSKGKGKRASKKSGEQYPGETSIAASGEVGVSGSEVQSESKSAVASPKRGATKAAGKGAVPTKVSAAAPTAKKAAKTVDSGKSTKTPPRSKSGKNQASAVGLKKSTSAAEPKHSRTPKATEKHFAKTASSKTKKGKGKPAAKVSGPTHKAGLSTSSRPKLGKAKNTARRGSSKVVAKTIKHPVSTKASLKTSSKAKASRSPKKVSSGTKGTGKASTTRSEKRIAKKVVPRMPKSKGKSTSKNPKTASKQKKTTSKKSGK